MTDAPTAGSGAVEAAPPPHDRARTSGRAVATVALLLVPGALTVWFAFHAGGYFVDTTALVAVGVAVLLALRIALAREPFEGVGVAVAVVAGAVALYAIWTLVSLRWSHAPARAMVEFDRALLYLLVLALFGSIARTPARVRWLVHGAALALFAVCTAGLITRVLPDVWSVRPTLQSDRLSYPLTYWNAVGVMAVGGIVLCVHLTCSEREHWASRVLAAAALPPLATALYLTLSRGAIAAGIVALVAYVVLARPRALFAGLVAAGPAAAIAVRAAYHAGALTEPGRAGARAIAEGHHVARTVVGAMLAAAVIRALLVPVDARVARLRLPPRLRLPVTAGATVLLLAAVVGAGAALKVPHQVNRQYDRFVHGSRLDIKYQGNARNRLVDPGNNGRVEHWKVALHGYDESHLHGSGAGTYQLLWARDRSSTFTVYDAHSLYVEVLGELGIPGLALIALALLTVLGVVAARIRGPERALYAAVWAAILAWVLHAGVDWDWEMPATAAWVLALAALAVARPAAAPRAPRPTSRRAVAARALLVAAVLVVAVAPGLLAASQVRLNRAADAYGRGDCGRAIPAARSSLSALRVRPEPYEIVGYCDLRLGALEPGLTAMGRAVHYDPDSWRVHYGLAIARAGSGRDPRREVSTALRLDPLEPLLIDTARRVATDSARKWRAWARTAAVPDI